MGVINRAQSIVEVIRSAQGLLGPQNLKIRASGPKIGAPCFLGNYACRDFLSFDTVVYPC